MSDALVDKAEAWVNKIYFNAEHLIRTGYWLRMLEPNANDALIIAAVTHDVERAFIKGRKSVSAELKGAKWDDHAHNEWHSKRSAKYVRSFLKKEGADKNLISEVSNLISHHEEGGWKEANTLRDADSISFLEINISFFISRIPKELSKEEVRDKFDYMFNRIGSKKAKKLAKPFYEKALIRLDELKD
jgi:hypothetical protein